MIEVIPRSEESIQAGQQNFQWFLDHWNSLTVQYAGQYVAVNDGKIIDSDKDWETLDKRTRNPETGESIGVFVVIAEEGRKAVVSILEEKR